MITVETLASSSRGNCYRLLSGGRSLLLECGIPWREIQKKLKFETSKLDGCLLSHAHMDHARAAKEIIKAGIDLYSSKECLQELGIDTSHRAKAIHESAEHLRFTGWFDIGNNWTVKAFDAIHDAKGPVSFIVKDEDDMLLFATDTAYIRYVIPNITLLMIEANYSESILRGNVEAGVLDASLAKRIRENHLSIERVVEFIKASGHSRMREIRLMHLSDLNSNEDLFKRTIQELTGVPVIVEEA